MRPHAPEVLLRGIGKAALRIVGADLARRMVQHEDSGHEAILELIIHAGSPPDAFRSSAGSVDAEDVTHGLGYLSERRPQSERLPHGEQDIARPASRLSDLAEGSLDGGLVPSDPPRMQPLDLRLDVRFIDRLELRRGFPLLLIAVHADHDPVSGLDGPLYSERSFADLVLDPPGLDGGHRTAHPFALLHVFRRPGLALSGLR